MNKNRGKDKLDPNRHYSLTQIAAYYGVTNRVAGHIIDNLLKLDPIDVHGKCRVYTHIQVLKVGVILASRRSESASNKASRSA